MRRCRRLAGNVGDTDDGDLGLVEVARDAGDEGLFHGDAFLDLRGTVDSDPCALAVVER
jgi:hypothetical protein